MSVKHSDIVFKDSKNNFDIEVDERKTRVKDTVEKDLPVHISKQQRAGKKCITHIVGLAKDLDQKKILSFMKKTFATSGTILKTKEKGRVIQLNGDQRKNALEFLVKCKICEKTQIKMHGE